MMEIITAMMAEVVYVKMKQDSYDHQVSVVRLQQSAVKHEETGCAFRPSVMMETQSVGMAEAVHE